MIFGPEPERHCFVPGCPNERNRGEATCGRHGEIACGSAWGVGTYSLPGWDEPTYGFPPTDMNPRDFKPDRECCTPEEIATWEAALAATTTGEA